MHRRGFGTSLTVCAFLFVSSPRDVVTCVPLSEIFSSLQFLLLRIRIRISDGGRSRIQTIGPSPTQKAAVGGRTALPRESKRKPKTHPVMAKYVILNFSSAHGEKIRRVTLNFKHPVLVHTVEELKNSLSMGLDVGRGN